MRIETYFQSIRQDIEAYAIIILSTVTYDKRGAHEGFIRGELTLSDGSILHFREFVDVKLTVDRLMYAYQYMDTDGNLVFRYDNSGHHRELNLSTYPHHKHDGSQDNITPSSAPYLNAILAEIEDL